MYRRAKKQKADVALMLGPPLDWSFPVDVVLTRISPRKLDTDNLARAFKAVRDQVSFWIGVNDADERVHWIYRQEKPGLFPWKQGIRIEVKDGEHG
jgi:hypothetical protein